MQSPKIGMIKLHLFLQKRVFTARATIMYLSIYMYLIIVSSFAKSGTDITHLNQHARPGLTAYVGIDNKIMKYVKTKCICKRMVNTVTHVLYRAKRCFFPRYMGTTSIIHIYHSKHMEYRIEGQWKCEEKSDKGDE